MGSAQYCDNCNDELGTEIPTLCPCSDTCQLRVCGRCARRIKRNVEEQS